MCILGILYTYICIGPLQTHHNYHLAGSIGVYHHTVGLACPITSPTPTPTTTHSTITTGYKQ